MSSTDLLDYIKPDHRLTDFHLVRASGGSLYRDPYVFVYLEEGKEHPYQDFQGEINPLGYCPSLTGYKYHYLRESAEHFCRGNEYSQRNYLIRLAEWQHKKKKYAKPVKDSHCYPIAKTVHFEIELGGSIGVLGFILVLNE